MLTLNNITKNSIQDLYQSTCSKVAVSFHMHILLILWKNSRSFKDPLLGLSRMCGARGGLGSQPAESLEKEKEEGPTTQRFGQTLRQARK